MYDSCPEIFKPCYADGNLILQYMDADSFSSIVPKTGSTFGDLEVVQKKL